MENQIQVIVRDETPYSFNRALREFGVLSTFFIVNNYGRFILIASKEQLSKFAEYARLRERLNMLRIFFRGKGKSREGSYVRKISRFIPDVFFSETKRTYIFINPRDMQQSVVFEEKEMSEEGVINIPIFNSFDSDEEDEDNEEDEEIKMSLVDKSFQPSPFPISERGPELCSTPKLGRSMQQFFGSVDATAINMFDSGMSGVQGNAMMDEIQQLKAQVNMLVQLQMQSLQQTLTAGPSVSARPRVPTPPSSDDESLIELDKPSAFVPPPPPPPPPPMPSMTPSGSQPLVMPKVKVEIPKAPITLNDVLKGLNTVQLRRIERSPGGTPLKKRAKSGAPVDHSSLIAAALKERFAKMNTPDSTPQESFATDDDSFMSEKENVSFESHPLKNVARIPLKSTAVNSNILDTPATEPQKEQIAPQKEQIPFFGQHLLKRKSQRKTPNASPFKDKSKLAF